MISNSYFYVKRSCSWWNSAKSKNEIASRDIIFPFEDISSEIYRRLKMKIVAKVTIVN